VWWLQRSDQVRRGAGRLAIDIPTSRHLPPRDRRIIVLFREARHPEHAGRSSVASLPAPPVYPSSGKLQRWPFAKPGPYADIRLPVAAAITTIEPLVSLAELGIGLACVPNFAVRGQIASGSLVKVLDEHLEHSGTFRAMWPASQHTSPKLRAFVNHMAEHLFPKAPS